MPQHSPNTTESLYLRALQNIYGVPLHLNQTVRYSMDIPPKIFNDVGTIVGVRNNSIRVLNSKTLKEDEVYPWSLQEVVK